MSVQQARALRLIPIEEGTAYWRVRAQTEDEEYFTKLPFLDPTGGHDGPWKEFIALSLAALVDVPVLRPTAVEVPVEVVPDSAPPLYLAGGNIFCGTSFCHKLVLGHGYGNLSVTARAQLFVFDNLIHNSDRAGPRADRNDCWLLEGQPVVLDFDMNQIGSDLSTAYFAWFGDHLIRGTGSEIVGEACRRTTLLLDEDIDAVCRRAAGAWPTVDADVAAAWLRGRRDNLVSAFLKKDRDTNSYPAWKPLPT